MTQPRLEVHHARPGRRQAGRPPILLIHGAWQAAWCWERWLPFMAEQGWDAHAVSLRGHGGSDGNHMEARLDDHLDDVRHAVAALGGSPVVVGHSLGGFLVQHLLAERRFPAAVLLAPAPRRYPLRILLRTAAKHPRIMLRDLRRGELSGLTATPQHVRATLFGDAAPDRVVIACQRRLTGASAAVFRDLFLRPPPAPLPGTPTLVLAGAQDGSFTPTIVRRVASRLDARLEILELSGHEIPLDVEWRRAAEITLDFLERALPNEQIGAAA